MIVSNVVCVVFRTLITRISDPLETGHIVSRPQRKKEMSAAPLHEIVLAEVNVTAKHVMHQSGGSDPKFTRLKRNKEEQGRDQHPSLVVREGRRRSSRL